MDAESSPAWCASLASLPDDLLCALVPEGRVLLMARTCKRFQLVLEKGRCDVDLRVRPQVCYDARLADVMTAGVNNLQLNFNIRRFECRALMRFCQLKFSEFEELTFIRGEAAIYQHIEKYDPPTFARIGEMVEAGRWDVVGGTYIQPDTNLTGAETLVRHFVRGQRYFRSRFGKTVTAGWQADSFGHILVIHTRSTVFLFFELT